MIKKIYSRTLTIPWTWDKMNNKELEVLSSDIWIFFSFLSHCGISLNEYLCKKKEHTFFFFLILYIFWVMSIYEHKQLLWGNLLAFRLIDMYLSLEWILIYCLSFNLLLCYYCSLALLLHLMK